MFIETLARAIEKGIVQEENGIYIIHATYCAGEKSFWNLLSLTFYYWNMLHDLLKKECDTNTFDENTQRYFSALVNDIEYIFDVVFDDASAF